MVRAGTAIPVDAAVVSGEAFVNQAALTGEPLPVRKAAGGAVFAGTVVEEGEIDIRPTGTQEDSRLNQIARFVDESERRKSGLEARMSHLADAIVPFNFLLAGLVFFFTRSLARTASVLLVDYSCALRLSTPLSVLTAMKEGVRANILIKGGRLRRSPRPTPWSLTRPGPSPTPHRSSPTWCRTGAETGTTCSRSRPASRSTTPRWSTWPPTGSAPA